MLFAFVALLLLLQIKHLVIDFKFQTMAQVHGKAIYGDVIGMSHSIEHLVGTLFALLPFVFFGVPLTTVCALAIADGVLHYHIDWAKMNLGNRDIQNPKFWWHLGIDQFAHQVTYLGIALFVFM